MRRAPSAFAVIRIFKDSVPLLPFFEVPCEKWLVFLGFMESGSEGSTNSRLMQTLNSKRVTSAISKTAKVELRVCSESPGDPDICLTARLDVNKRIVVG